MLLTIEGAPSRIDGIVNADQNFMRRIASASRGTPRQRPIDAAGTLFGGHPSKDDCKLLDTALTEMTTPRSEMEIISMICSGNTHLFHELIRPYERTVYGVIMRMLRNEADVEDAVQETLLKAILHLSQFRFESKFSTWLIGIAVNEARTRLRHGKRMPSSSLDDESESFSSRLVLMDHRDSPAKNFERKQMEGMLHRTIEGLPPIYRDVILRALEERSIAETADMLGINPVSVKVRLHRARFMIRHGAPWITRVSQ